MALALARAREDDCDALEGSPVYDSIGERVGWVGQVLEESGYPCEHMGMGDEGYTSCWSSSEISRLREKNEKLRELVIAYVDSFETNAALNNGEGPYYSGEDWLGLANDMRLELAECCGELGIEVD